MIVPYSELPGGVEAVPRPVLDVMVGDVDDVRFPCIVDSGALNTLLPRWMAEVAAVDLSDAETRGLGVAGGTTKALVATVPLAVVGHRWEAEVGFCDPWPYSWGLLGQQSFFRHFEVTFRAADFELELTANDR